ncbi:hypothetical protein HKCCE3408_12250 [Rhodobacterales bacterium HKCCE3408]|nr:hypothetical protein [Rhodobacterales bacterium HKCCE3408]
MVKRAEAKDGDVPELPALALAIECVEDAERLMRASLPEIADFDYIRVLLSVTPGIESVVCSAESVFYRVGGEAAEWLAIEATGSPDAMAMVREICACNIWEGEPVPKELRGICRSIVSGKGVGVARTGPQGGQRFGAFLVAQDIAQYLKDAYGIPLSRGDGFNEISAADILSEAFRLRGLNVTSGTIRDWLTHGKHKVNRARANAIIHMFRCRYLEALGLTKPGREWVVGPDAQLWPIGRMRVV